MGWHLDGRVTAVVGTHTHVPTADARVLPGGTAYITDVGMTGPRGGVIGVKREQAIESLLTQMPVRFETSEEDPWLMGVLVSCSGAVASGLDRAGADASAGGLDGGSPKRPSRASMDQPEKPRDVEVEPVFDPELYRDDHRRTGRREADQVCAPGDHREPRARAPRRLYEPAGAPVPAIQTPDGEG